MRCCESGGGGSTEAAMGVVGPYDAQISRTPHSREPKTISHPSATFGPSVVSGAGAFHSCIGSILWYGESTRMRGGCGRGRWGLPPVEDWTEAG